MSDESSMSLAEVRARYMARPHTYAASLVQALETEVARLQVLVSDAYVEGHMHGGKQGGVVVIDAEHAWTQSRARATLRGEENDRG
jgi:hypothetical protein